MMNPSLPKTLQAKMQSELDFYSPLTTDLLSEKSPPVVSYASADGASSNEATCTEFEASFHPIDSPPSVEGNQRSTAMSTSARTSKLQIMTAPQHLNPLLQGILEPRENDCLVGRGGGTNHHIGNKRYRALVEGYKEAYRSASRSEKPIVAMLIVKEWRAQDPPGRFLQQDDGTMLWNDVGDERAKLKTSQTLREKSIIKTELEENGDCVANSLTSRELDRHESTPSPSMDLGNSNSVCSKRDTEMEVMLAVNNVASDIEGYLDQDGTLADAYLEFPSMEKSPKLIKARFDIQITSPLASDCIATLTKRIYAAISETCNTDKCDVLAPNSNSTAPIDAEKAEAFSEKRSQMIRDESHSMRKAHPERAAESTDTPTGSATWKWSRKEDETLRKLIGHLESPTETITSASKTAKIRWTQIAENMGDRTPKQCRERWINHLRPGLKKGYWTPEEDLTIKALQKTLGNSWNKIAAQLKGRTDNDVKNRWHSWIRTQKNKDNNMKSPSPCNGLSTPINCSNSLSSVSSEEELASMSLLRLRESPLVPFTTGVEVKRESKKRESKSNEQRFSMEDVQPKLKKPKNIPTKNAVLVSDPQDRNHKITWSIHDDALLTNLVQRKPCTDEYATWSRIAEEMKNRTAKQCRERWMNQIRPDRKKGNWTVEEDSIILSHQKEWGNSWSKIARLLPGRSDNDVKNRWYSSQRTKKREDEDTKI